MTGARARPAKGKPPRPERIEHDEAAGILSRRQRAGPARHASRARRRGPEPDTDEGRIAHRGAPAGMLQRP